MDPRGVRYGAIRHQRNATKALWGCHVTSWLESRRVILFSSPKRFKTIGIQSVAWGAKKHQHPKHLFEMVKRYTYRMKVNHHKNAIITNSTKAPARDPGPLRGGLPPEPLARRTAGIPPSPPNLPVNRLIEHRFFPSSSRG